MARAQGCRELFVPDADAAEVALIPDLEIIPVKSLAELCEHLSGGCTIEPFQCSREGQIPLAG
jgi:magnesium chelatase family protein